MRTWMAAEHQRFCKILYFFEFLESNSDYINLSEMNYATYRID